MNVSAFSIRTALQVGFSLFWTHLFLLFKVTFLSVALSAGAGLIIKGAEYATGTTASSYNRFLGNSSYFPIPSFGNSTDTTADSAAAPESEKIRTAHGSFGGRVVVSILCLFAFFLNLIILLGWNRIGLDLYDRGSSTVSRFLEPASYIGTYLFGVILYILFVLGGLILFIIPGILWAIRYHFFDLYILSERCTAWQALQKSYSLVTGNSRKIGLFWVICSIIGAVSVITVVGPVIFTYITLLSRIYIFRTLQKHQPFPTPIM